MYLSQIKLLFSMALFEAQRFRVYPLEIVGALGARFAELALYITFWLIVGRYSASGAIKPLDVISYFMIITGLMPLFYLGFGIGSNMIDLIKSGELSQILIKPVNPLLYPWATRTGRNLINTIVGVAQVIIGMYLVGGIRA